MSPVMKRRDFVKSGILVGGAALWPRSTRASRPSAA